MTPTRRTSRIRIQQRLQRVASLFRLEAPVEVVAEILGALAFTLLWPPLRGPLPVTPYSGALILGGLAATSAAALAIIVSIDLFRAQMFATVIPPRLQAALLDSPWRRATALRLLGVGTHEPAGRHRLRRRGEHVQRRRSIGLCADAPRYR